MESIDNINDLMSEVINNILPVSSKVDILVGFFYFSGFKWLYKELKDKKIRILIWMDAEINIINSVAKVNEISKNIASKKETIREIKDIFNKTDDLDNLEWLEAVKIYIDKIVDWSLEIRKTLEPNHTKLYLFEHEGEISMWWTMPWTVISGSSNLTYSGLTWRYEYNTIDRDKSSYIKAKRMFDDIWENHSIKITSWWEDDEVVKMLKQETWLKLTKPYYCYLRLLYEYFSDKWDIKTPKDLTDNKFQNLEYQVDAIKKWLRILEEHNWVIIADVVWLWKSVIWSTLLWNLWKKALLIVPPHLIDSWKSYIKDFDIKWEVFSSWSIEKALEYDLDDIHKAEVILIDEAHKYRNSETIDYWNLHQLCQWKKVILLSATPFNNEPNDIFNLIKLFQIPSNPTIHTRKWLINDFRDLQNKYIEIKKEQRKGILSDLELLSKIKKLSDEIRQVICPVIVRRSRVDLVNIESYKKDLEKQWYEFSKVSDPKELNFTLWNLEKLYIDTLEKLVETDEEWNPLYFAWARYKVLTYLQDAKKYEEEIEDTLWYEYALFEWRQKNMPFFIRRLLVSRFESSIYSFKKTLKSILKSIDNVFSYLDLLNWVPVIKKWWLPDIEDIFDEWLEKDENIEKIREIIDNKWWILIPKQDLKSSFIKDLESDKEFLQDLLEDWENVEQDPKLDNFLKKIKEIQKQDPKRKIIVFSMFADTINYLSEKLNDRVLVVSWKQKTEKLKQDVKLNFDAWVEKSKQKNDYDILLWTDAISEWYNLHRAWVIINYDIPYNPTKVIQRIWRINRINKKVFDELFVYNYFPSFIWEEYVNTKKISTLKIKMIATVLWVDVKTLSEDEEISSFYTKIIEEDNQVNEDKSWDSEFLNDFKKAQELDKDLLKKIEQVPQRTRILRVEKKWVSWILVFAKKRSNLIFYFFNSKTKKVEPISLVDAFNLFKADITEEPKETTKDFYKYYEKIKQEIKNPHAEWNMNTQQKKAYDNAENLFNETGDNYYKLLMEVIRMWALPLVYMKRIRKITKETWQKEKEILKELINEDYLRLFLEMRKNFDEEMLDLIISEEFIN